MRPCVIDASAASEYLLRTPSGLALEELIQDADLAAPELLDIEVLSVLRRAVLSQRLTAARAGVALADLAAWPILRIPHAGLVQEAWRHRHNLSAYDATYVAAANLMNAVLLTTDGPLARAPDLGITVQNIRVT